MNDSREQHWHQSPRRLLNLFLLVLAALTLILWGYKRYETYQMAQRLQSMTRHYAEELDLQMKAVETERQKQASHGNTAAPQPPAAED